MIFTLQEESETLGSVLTFMSESSGKPEGGVGDSHVLPSLHILMMYK